MRCANLRIVRTVGRRLFRDIQNLRDWLGIDAALRMLLDDHLANGWDEIRPEEIGAFLPDDIFEKGAL